MCAWARFPIWCAHLVPYFFSSFHSDSACDENVRQKHWNCFTVWSLCVGGTHTAHTQTHTAQRFQKEKFLILFFLVPFLLVLPLFNVLPFQSCCLCTLVAVTRRRHHLATASPNAITLTLPSVPRRTTNGGCRHYPHRFGCWFQRLCK